MQEQFQYDVFLSHSSKDKAIVRDLAERLKKDGLKVWFDEWEIRPGDNILHEIEEGLENSRVMLLCMSKNAFGSDWAQLESGTFRFRDPLNKDRRFIPLCLDDSPIKGSLAQFRYISWLATDREHEYPKIIDSCSPPSLPANLTEAQKSFASKVISLGHTESVNSVGWSPDGKRALSGSHDKTLRLWDIESGQCLRVFEGHTESVNSVGWSPDGKRALSGSDDNTLRLWDIESGQCLRVFEGHTKRVFSVGWSPDGKRALSGSGDMTLRLWDIESGQCLRVFVGHVSDISCICWRPDGKRALSGSYDGTVRLWNILSGQNLCVFEGHKSIISSVGWSPDGKRALSGSGDTTLRLWDVESGRCLRVFKGHNSVVSSVGWSPNGKRALSGSVDKTLRLWNIESGQCLRVFEGHTEGVWGVAWSPDGKRALSGSTDNTLRLWDIESGQCLRVFEGHTDWVRSVGWSPDGKRTLSGSEDKTLRLWDIESGQCLRVFEGHTDIVWSVGWSPHSERALSGSPDKTLRLWDIESGQCLRVFEGHTEGVWDVAWSPDGRYAFSVALNGVMRIWDMQVIIREADTVGTLGIAGSASGEKIDVTPDQVQYTNAKVLLVGDTSSGKTGLAHRLATGKWKSSDGSTVGAWATQWYLAADSTQQDLEQEIWLWDFAGQADQRLVHQLHMDQTALYLLLFDAGKEDVLTGLREWQTALRRCVDPKTPRFLVAGRTDAGFKASRTKIEGFAQENRFQYYETSAKDGDGCKELEEAVKNSILWEQMEKRTSPRIFKLIKSEILRLRDEGKVFHTFKELREEIWKRLPDEPHFTEEVLRTVISLLDGPGIVKELDYGTYILLQPEWINVYAQAVLRTIRQDPHELGCLPLRSIAEGKLIFQTVEQNGEIKKVKRLPPADERVVLREMERQLEEKGLCLRQGDKLVFPSHCGRDRPAVEEHPSVFVRYRVNGYLDDIYATLVVKLADSESFELGQLWRDAADFASLDGAHHMGIKLTRESEQHGDISVFFAPGVTKEEQVIFANYIHTHLTNRCENVQRLRHYVCPHCQTPKGNSRVLMEKLLEKKTEAAVICDKCDRPFGLWDDLEKRFSSDFVRKQVEGLIASDVIRLDSRRKGKLLTLEVASRITSADQKCFDIPATEDEGIDMEVEFTDDDGKGNGVRVYLQLKSGNSHLRKRLDGSEVFPIKEQRWVDYWLKQPHPVMLVIGTFAEEDERFAGKDKLEYADVRWMEISSYLKRETDNGKKKISQIEFKGERLDMTSVRRLRDRMLNP